MKRRNNNNTGQRLSLYEKLLLIQKNNLLSMVVRFAKSALFHIAFESAITVYITEIFIILSRYYLVNPSKLSGTLMLIVVPILFAAPISLLFAIIGTLFFVYKLSDIVQFPEKQTYYDLKRKHHLRLFWGHLIGTAFYILTPALIAKTLVRFYSDRFLPNAKVEISIIVVCGIQGLLWNVTGFFRDQRILWNQVLPKSKKVEGFLDQIAISNYRNIKWNFIMNIISLFPAVVLLVFTFFNLNHHLQSEDALRAFTTNYRFLTISFVSLLAIYVKYGYSLLYSERNREAIIYPPLKTVLEVGQKSLEKKDIRSLQIKSQAPNERN